MAKTYDTYKDCSSSFIGKVPNHWEFGNFRYSGIFTKGKLPLTTNVEGVGKPIIGASEMLGKDNRLFTNSNDVPCCTKDDILILWDGANAGITSSNHEGVISSTTVKYHCTDTRINKRYLSFIFKMAENQFKENVNGTTIPHMNMKFINEIPLLKPSIHEQQAIATYLDEKCGEIDSLISLQEEMISELQTYKQSVITEAVTKGLDPNVPMKDSGVEWIGMIPEGWNICKLKFLCSSIKDGSHFSPTTTEEGFPYITAADVHGKGLDYANAKKISEKDYNDLVQSGCKAEKDDILLVKDGATTGRVGMKIENNPCVLLSSVAMLRVNTKSYPTYLMYMVSSNLLQQQISIAMAGSAMPRITLTKLNTFIALEVPLSEQQAIASYLDEKTSQIDSLIALKQEKITELKDYKKSIIYEYVTGKKKV